MLSKYILNDARGSEVMLFQAELLYAELCAPWRKEGHILFLIPMPHTQQVSTEYIFQDKLMPQNK